jgi:hypothetical protein
MPRAQTPHRVRSRGVFALGVFFAFGALMSLGAAISLLSAGSPLEPMWRLNPDARRGLAAIGRWGILLMVAVSAACAGSAAGLWMRAGWGRRLALGVLTVNLIGDLLGALIRHDSRTLLGLPIGGALIAYLLSASVRQIFEPGTATSLASRRSGPSEDTQS